MPAAEGKCKDCGCELVWNARHQRWEPSALFRGLTCRVTGAAHRAVKR